MSFFRLAGDQRARRDVRHDSDAEEDDDVRKVRELCGCSTFHKHSISNNSFDYLVEINVMSKMVSE